MTGFTDKDTCVGCGLCPEIFLEIFKMDDDGKDNKLYSSSHEG